MNLHDGGKNRRPMDGIGLKGLKSTLIEVNLWRDGMTLKEARDILWKWDVVKAQMSRIEKLCAENGIVLVYESKAHPGFNPGEVLLIIILKYRRL